MPSSGTRNCLHVSRLILHGLAVLGSVAALALFILATVKGASAAVAGGYVAAILSLLVNCYALFAWHSDKTSGEKNRKVSRWLTSSPVVLCVLHLITAIIIIALAIYDILAQTCPRSNDNASFNLYGYDSITSSRLMGDIGTCSTSIVTASALLLILFVFHLLFSAAACAQMCMSRHEPEYDYNDFPPGPPANYQQMPPTVRGPQMPVHPQPAMSQPLQPPLSSGHPSFQQRPLANPPTHQSPSQLTPSTYYSASSTEPEMHAAVMPQEVPTTQASRPHKITPHQQRPYPVAELE